MGSFPIDSQWQWKKRKNGRYCALAFNCEFLLTRRFKKKKSTAEPDFMKEEI